MPDSLLTLSAISKHYGAVTALDGASLVVRAGTVHALLGENGAGKTTLMGVAFGGVQPDAGRMTLDGKAVRWRSPADAIAAGVGMVHQHYALVDAMTVAENVALGGRGLFRRQAAAARVRAIGEATGLVLDPGARAGSLGVAARQRLEIVKALAREARLLILDEPTAVLAPAESAELLRWVRRFASEGQGTGRAVVLITHKLREALAIADDVTVLRRGRTVLARAAAGTTEDALADAMLGGAGVARASAGTIGEPERARDPAPPRSVVIRAESLVLRDERGTVRVREATFAVHAGEIVGVAAVEGSGQRELLRALAGRLAPAGGRLALPARVGFVPEDRHRDALVLDFDLAENVALHELGARRGLMPWRAIAEATRALLARHDVRAPGWRAAARTLSGGNQQKLVLARELAESPAALVVESPTRGLDIRASAAVHERLRAARDAGAAVVVSSGDLDEVLALADRVLVVYAGTVRECPVDRELVGRAMLGA